MAVSDWIRDLRHSVRALRRTPGFTLMAVGTLGLAIGANAGMFSVVNTVLLSPLPYGNPDRLVFIAASAPGSDLPPEFGVSAEFFVQYKEQSKLLEEISTFNSFTSTMRTENRVERIRMSMPTSSLFRTLGVQPLLGRVPVEADEGKVAVISHALWMSWFGGDPNVLHRTYSISGSMREIVGVMGPDFRFPHEGTLVWLSNNPRTTGITPGRFGANLVARMAPGTTPEAVANELTTLAKRLPERFGGTPAYARIIGQHRAIVRPLETELLGDVKQPLWVLLGAVAIVLVIACANVANLFMVRAEGRQRDLAVRRAIGAARSQLVRLQMCEALIVAVLAGAVAVGLAYVSLPAFLRAAPAGVPRLASAGVTGVTWLFTFGAVILSAVSFGIGPALRASAPDFTRLREGGRSGTSRRRWLRDGLVAGQTALALVLLIGSALLIRSFWQLRHVDPGYDTKDLFTFQIAPEGRVDGPGYARFDLAFLDRLRALPGVESAGLVENVPIDEGTATTRVKTERTSADAEGAIVHMTFAAGDYFKTMGIDQIAGRPFDTNDHVAALPNAIVGKKTAALLWPGEHAIGKRFLAAGVPAWYTVVGVVDDVMQNNLREAADPLIYFPLVGPQPNTWVISSPAYVLRTPRAEQIAPDVRALVAQVAPEAPMYRVYTMAELARSSMVQLSFTMLTLGIAAALALVLGAVGLYGVLSYVVAERTREIGVRMALGAQAPAVRWMVVKQGAQVVALGVGVGVAAALLTTRALGSLLFNVAPVDAVTFAAMSMAMVAIGLLASYVPAWRASRVDPIESLRGD